MVEAETIEWVADLAQNERRRNAAAKLARRFEARALFAFVHDPQNDALQPLLGLPRVRSDGAEWRALLERCARPGLHRGDVAYPTKADLVPALACAGAGVSLVFVDPHVESARLESLQLLLPLLAAALRAQRAAGANGVELAATHADLERQTQALIAAQHGAREAQRAKDEFLAMLGHELRNPLAPIVTALQVMRMRGRHSREQDILERQVGQLMRLVDDLLDVSRITRGRFELRREQVELAAVVVRAVEMASPLLEQRQQTLSVELPQLAIALDADPTRLAQVFANLLTNAAKYSAPSSHVRLRAERTGDVVRVSVQDRGLGIEPDMLDAIFDPFVQQQQSLQRSEGGLGLGLAIVRSLVAMHGGSVRAHSAGRGQGSEFVVELPVAASATLARRRDVFTPHALLEAHAQADRRILVVDDNRDAADLLCEALGDLGYVVRSAHDGPSALDVANEFHPHIGLLDIGLPAMDGYELARCLRGASDGTQLRLVALTGYGQESDKARSREAGFDEHLTKPIDLEVLERVLAGFAAS